MTEGFGAARGVDDREDCVIDFTNVGLYIAGIQSVLSVVVCSAVSILSCWIVPPDVVSAVRTLACCIAAAVAIMRAPLRIGRVHGVGIVFNALRPCVAVYILSLVLEQLVHTCVTSASTHMPSWRRVVFQGMCLAMFGSGMLRARNPLADTDLPFLITTAAMLVMALLPPPAVALAGPLCEPASLLAAGERIVRALTFASLYTVFVYSSAPSNSGSSEVVICVSRATAASVWALGSTPIFLVLAVPQCGVAVYARLNANAAARHEYAAVAAAEAGDVERASPRGMGLRATLGADPVPGANCCLELLKTGHF